VDPAPFLIAEVFASNIGGTATLIGDPPNIIIASRAGLSFNDMLLNLAPIIVVEMAVFVLLLPWIFPGAFQVDPDRVRRVMSLNEREAIEDHRLLVKSGIVMALVLAGFVTHSVTHIEPSVIALLGAGLLVLISSLDARDYMASVEWETLLFFAGLFVMVGALVKVGVIEDLASRVAGATEGRALVAMLLILFGSAVLSAVVNNVPYVASMSPLVEGLTRDIPDPTHAESLWWALTLGADLGGNATAVGASANVVVLGIALRSGTQISFWEFTRKGMVVTAVTILVAAPYLWLRYFALA
jgi:Na+/H+ antiporter NhaD/arsenite permease-like protein